MANSTTTKDTITVHGRGSLRQRWKHQRKAADGTITQTDLSGRTIFFEVDGLQVPIREQVVPDPADPLGIIIVLENEQVRNLKLTPTQFTLIDETEGEDGLPVVLWEGKINRYGYVGLPDQTDGE